jgi:hypothetical protein
MEKLTFYALSSPEKLDRIGEYLARKVARDLYRHRNGYLFLQKNTRKEYLEIFNKIRLKLCSYSYGCNGPVVGRLSRTDS